MTAPPDRAARVAAAARAGHEGDVVGARAALGDPDPDVRAVALGALARAGALDGPTATAALGDASPKVRRRACELAAAGGAEPGAVVARLADADPFVAEAAAFACGELDHLPPEGWAALAAAARASTEPLVREAAVAALGAREDERARATVLEALGDVVTVRRRAVIALAPFTGPDIVAALEKAAADRDWQVRNAAIDLLRYKRDDLE